ncbi:hypothetical protein PRIPAC_83041 [Pristionchus pacificus]|uniref:Uncharacterized protein n=1 Tax=Pristionchus pacificus TaxID=54126 RepID=A0A2A6C353_PRIPA|nr:hypothetical protein PRIPAC_83041 [Pristionchus pacificus]|eukprot:PDM72537.1 hypothetical protein PRIPAC_38971 [Pristionchus pacificus]
MKKNTRLYLLINLIISYFEERSTMCDVPDVYHIQSKFLWAVSFCSVYITALLLYIYVWSKLVRNVIGWLFPMGSMLIASVLYDLEDYRAAFQRQLSVIPFLKTRFERKVKVIGSISELTNRVDKE